MQINNITLYSAINNAYPLKSPKDINQSVQTYPVTFMGRFVSKELSRFHNFTEFKMPPTMRHYVAGLKDLSAVTPLDAHKNAYMGLKDARTVLDVQRTFPDDELFKNLLTINETESKVGLIGIYKEFQEIFPDGILKSGEDFTIYLLRKIFIEAKKYDDISKDLDNDLVPDIKTYFRAKYERVNKISTENKEEKFLKPFVDGKLIEALGIIPPDAGYRTSLRATDEDFLAFLRLRISEGVRAKWESYTEEEKKEIIIKRLKARDDWWNGLSSDEKLEIATEVISNEELFAQYKEYKNINRFVYERPKTEDQFEFEQSPKKRIKVGSGIKDKDLFVLWMKRNLEKFYATLSEEDLELIKIKRSKRMAQRWAEMTPVQKTEYINSLRIKYEPIKYAMIDAWNHSRLLKRALSEFLSAKQVDRPFDVIYSDEAFKEFQSKIMTEFWAANEDLAKDFGARLKYSHQIVEDAIKAGKFEDLKFEIEQERIKQIKEFYKNEKPAENKAKEEVENKTVKNTPVESAESKVKEVVDNTYRDKFAKEYKTYIDAHNVLPYNYVKELTGIMLESFPKDFIIKYTKFMQDKVEMPDDILKVLTEKGNKHDCPRLERIIRALEAAIAAELVDKGANPAFFEMTSDALIPILEQRAANVHLSRHVKPDIDRINRLYNGFKQDIDSDTANQIINEYFGAKVEDNKTMQVYQELADYIDTYGQSIKIIFSDRRNYSDKVKNAFNRKFLKFMPQSIKDKMYIYQNNEEDIKLERELSDLKGKIAKRLEYIPDDIRERYIHTLFAHIRSRKVYNNGFDINVAKEFTKRAKVDAKHDFSKLPKDSMALEDKLKMLSVEQAMEDELYSIAKNYAVYSAEFEEAVSAMEMCSYVKPNKGEGVIVTTSGGEKLLFPRKPNLKNLKIKYLNYYNKIKYLMENISDYNDKFDTEELLHCLSPNENNLEKRENVRKRIDVYFKD